MAPPAPEAEGSTTSAPEPSFKTGATKLWTLSSEELFGQQEGSNFDTATVNAYSFAETMGDLLVFGSYTQMRAVDPAIQQFVWEQTDVDPIGRCAIEVGKDLLYCPTGLQQGGRADAILAIDSVTGQSTEIPIQGRSGLTQQGIEDIGAAPDGLIIYQRDSVSKTDFNGNVLWEQSVETKSSENRYMQVGETSVLISEPAASLTTVMSLDDGIVLGTGADANDNFVSGNLPYYSNIPGSRKFDWDTDGRFADNGNCLFAVGDVLLFAPDNCYVDAGVGTVSAYDPQTGDLLWNMEVTGLIQRGGSTSYLTTVQGLQRVGTKTMFAFDSITVYGPAEVSDPKSLTAVEPGSQVNDAADKPEQIPNCPASTILLSWAQLSNGWVLVCGISETEPTVWMSQFDNEGEVTTSNVSYAAHSGSSGYLAKLPSGSVFRMYFDSSEVEQLDNAGTLVETMPILIIHFVNLGTREVSTTQAASNKDNLPNAANTPNSKAPTASPNAPSEPAPSSAFCPVGSKPYFEGETSDFVITICTDPSNAFTYVGYSPTAGEMLLPAEDLGTHWLASNASHAYSVSSTYLDVYDLSSNSNIVHQAFIWTRQY